MHGKGGIESLRPSYKRPKFTLISSVAEMGNFSFNQFRSHFLPNDFAFWQFSNGRKIAKMQSDLEKKAMELTKLWGSFFLQKIRSTLKFFHGVCVSKYFLDIRYGSTLKKLTLTFFLIFFPDIYL